MSALDEVRMVKDFRKGGSMNKCTEMFVNRADEKLRLMSLAEQGKRNAKGDKVRERDSNWHGCTALKIMTGSLNTTEWGTAK